MPDTRLPTEVELIYEVMPCNALRTSQEPAAAPHACTYFRKWGTYHSYDYREDGPPPQPGIVQDSIYLGRAPLVPEVLSGCRKAPILAIGINPNLPGWWPASRNSLNPLFDDYKQFAHYFRYRTVAKLQVPRDDYQAFGGGPADRPFSDFELDVPQDAAGARVVPVELQSQKMYVNYQALLDDLATAMGWDDGALTVGEDLSYANMVACGSAKWATQSADPALPVMTVAQRNGIVQECFHKRRYFLRQLFQSLPRVILIFSRSTTQAFIGELADRFTAGNPSPDDSLDDLMEREVRLQYGLRDDSTPLEARVVFAPHITGTPAEFAAAKPKVVAQLVAEAQAGRLQFNPATKHLRRPEGACVFCTMLEIGKCDYADELVPLSSVPVLTADSPMSSLVQERAVQAGMLDALPPRKDFAAWTSDDDRTSP